MYWHVVLISFRVGVTESRRNEVLEKLRCLGENCGGRQAGIISWKVEWNLDLRKGVNLVEVGIFENEAAFRVFCAHERHKKIGKVLGKVADWKIGDFQAPMPR